MFRLIFVVSTIFICLELPTVCLSQQVNDDILFDSLHNDIKLKIGQQKYSEVILILEDFIDSNQYAQFKCWQRAMLNHRLGLAYHLSENFNESFNSFSKRTIPIWDDCTEHDEILEAHSKFNAAMSAQYLNKFDEGISYLNNALSIYEADSSYPSLRLGTKYRGAGFLYLEAGEMEIAELFYLKSIVSFKKSDNADFQLAESYNDLGRIYRRTGNFKKAVEYFQKSTETDKRLLFHSCYNLAAVYIEELNDLGKARHYAELAQRAAIDATDYSSIVKSYNTKGRIEFKSNNHEAAIEFYNKGLEFCDSVFQNNPNVIERANIRLHLAEAKYEKGDLDMAIEEVDKAILLMMPDQPTYATNMIVNKGIIRDRIQLIDMLSVKADFIFKQNLVNSKTEEVDKALKLYYKIDTLFRLNLADISLNNSLIQASSSMTAYYENAIINNLNQYSRTNQKKYFESAFYFSSQLKALILSNTLRKYKSLDAADDKHLRDLYSRLNTSLVEYYNEKTQTDSLSSEIIEIQMRIYEFEESIKNKYSDILNSFSEDKLESISDIQQKLKSDEVILEYFEGERTLYCFVISKNDYKYHQIDLTQKRATLINDFIASCQNVDVQSLEAIQDNGLQLYSLLMQPLLQSLQNIPSKIIVVPDGLIHALPLEALMVDKANYVLHDYNVVYAYSHKLYFDKQTTITNDRYVGFGPQYSEALSQKLIDLDLLEPDESLADLKMGITEVKTSSDYYLNQSIHINENATKTQFVDVAESADILHLSMHGLVDYAVPDNSSLIFHDKVEDFVLNSAEITALNLDPDIVILSSCHSAAGAITKGEGVQGLSRAFILAGSSSVLSSLWSSSEYSSAQLLPKFFKNLTAGSSKSSSLREAKLDYLSTARPSLQHPFYWANYILLTHSEASPFVFSPTYLYGLLILLIALALFYFFIKKRK